MDKARAGGPDSGSRLAEWMTKAMRWESSQRCTTLRIASLGRAPRRANLSLPGQGERSVAQRALIAVTANANAKKVID
jgi:hypothetical protein